MPNENFLHLSSSRWNIYHYSTNIRDSLVSSIFTARRSGNFLHCRRSKRRTTMNWTFFSLALLGKWSLPPYPVTVTQRREQRRWKEEDTSQFLLLSLPSSLRWISVIVLRCLMVYLTYPKICRCICRTSCCKRCRSCFRITSQLRSEEQKCCSRGGEDTFWDRNFRYHENQDVRFRFWFWLIFWFWFTLCQ
jgi:hypothetical protein